MRILFVLPLTGCLAGATAAGSGDLLITEFGDVRVSTDDTVYVEVGNPTATDVDLSGYTLGIYEDAPSIPLSGTLAAGEGYTLEIGGGGFADIFGFSADERISDAFAFVPDEVRLYLADGSGFEGASTTRNDATFQDVIGGADIGEADLRSTHLCRRSGVPRGRGRFDETEWVVSDVFAIDSSDLAAIANPGQLGCP